MLKELMDKIEAQDLSVLDVEGLQNLNREFAEGQKFIREYRIKINEEVTKREAAEHAKRVLEHKTDEQKRALLQELTAKSIPTEEAVRPAGE